MGSTRPGPAPADHGQGSVELALTLPVVAMLLLALLQVALVARDTVLVTHAAREAARSAAVEGSATAARAAAQQAADLDPDRLTVDLHDAGSLHVRAEVAYRIRTDVPLVGELLGDPTVHARATMRREIALKEGAGQTDANRSK